MGTYGLRSIDTKEFGAKDTQARRCALVCASGSREKGKDRVPTAAYRFAAAIATPDVRIWHISEV
jgi:hypothetical protein